MRSTFQRLMIAAVVVICLLPVPTGPFQEYQAPGLTRHGVWPEIYANQAYATATCSGSTSTRLPTLWTAWSLSDGDGEYYGAMEGDHIVVALDEHPDSVLATIRHEMLHVLGYEEDDPTLLRCEKLRSLTAE